MLEDYCNDVKDIFSKFPECAINATEVQDDLIVVSFHVHDLPLIMTVSSCENRFFRRVAVFAAPKDVTSTTILPHFLKFDEENKLYRLCLLDEAQYVFSGYSLSEHISLYLSQTISLLSLSQKKIEQEYLREFSYYWRLTAYASKSEKIITDIEVYLPDKNEASLLNCWKTNTENGSEKYCLISDKLLLNSVSTPKGTLESALFIPISYPQGIVPPHDGYKWTRKDILNIICNPIIDRISHDTFVFLKKEEFANLKKVIVFSFQVDNSIPTTFCALLEFSSNSKKNLIEKVQDEFVSIRPLASTRMDLAYLNERIGQNCRKTPNVLVVGCGSVGSYIIPELVKLGITSIGISDDDLLESGNSFRHHLGPHYHGNKKSVAMKWEIEYQNPLVHVSLISNLLLLKEEELTSLLEPFDIVIVAVGSTDVQRKLNFLFSKYQLPQWFIFNWLDSAGKGLHALVMQYSRRGCFNCLFKQNGIDLRVNKGAFSDGSEEVISNGCGGAFTPYGNNVLLRNTSLVISLIQKIQENGFASNTYISAKNDFSSLIGSTSINPIIDQHFYDESCDVCGAVPDK